MSFDDFFRKKEKEIIKEQKYPIIWKTESCLRGECKEGRTVHRWSLPFSEPDGLVCECYDCHKTKRIHVEKEDLSQPPSDFIRQRRAELDT